MHKRIMELAFFIAFFAVSVVAQVTGSGTADYVPVFTGNSTIGNLPNAVFGSKVGTGTTTPAESNTYGDSAWNVYGPLYAWQNSSFYSAIGTSGGTTYFAAEETENNFQFYIKNTDRLSILNKDNVGIDTTNPQAKFKINNNLRFTADGSVQANVTIKNSPIHTGDALVTSSKPSYAMKDTDRTKMLGAVIGKSLVSVDSGTGLIEVVVT